jgi:hypothetical protein
VRCIESAGDNFFFELSVKEHGWFTELIGRYPMVPVAHHSLSRAPSGDEYEADQALLEEALAEHRAETRRQVQDMLEEKDRFQKTASGVRLRLESGEIDWLLEVLNDVRVGCWIRLGKPDTAAISTLEITSENAGLIWGMELCGFFQAALMAAREI